MTNQPSIETQLVSLPVITRSSFVIGSFVIRHSIRHWVFRHSSFHRSLGLSSFVIFCFLLLACYGRADERVDERPNVLLIYSDDQGAVDLNCYGAHDLTTPCLDQLAQRGVRFTQFYSAAPVCSPSRAALLTGRFPQRAQLAENAGSQPGGTGMPAAQVTLAELMQGAGYVTGHVGKWHLGYTPQTMPNSQGFADSFGHMGGCLDNYSHYFYWSGPNRHDLWDNGQEVWAPGAYLPDLMVERCTKFVTDHRFAPFLLYWAINVPHYPVQPSEKWRQHYADLPHPRSQYAAFVSTMDECIGQVLEHLESEGLEQNTIVIFQSDQGHSTEERSFSGGGSAGPYRGAKFSLFEGGIRVPAIVSWPTELPQGEVRDQLATSVDWLPTILEFCGVPQPAHRIDGVSLANLIRHREAPPAHDVFHWESGRGANGQPQWAVRQGTWKLLGNPIDTSHVAPLTPEDDLMLIDLATDTGERTNMRQQHPEIVDQLLKLHQQWRTDVEQQ